MNSKYIRFFQSYPEGAKTHICRFLFVASTELELADATKLIF